MTIIPAGKKIIIKQDSQPITELMGIDIVLNEPLTLSLTSNFSDLVSGETSSAISALAGVVRDKLNVDIPTSFKQFGLQVWNKTEPISFSVIVELNMKTNALTDVYKPALRLMKLPLPGENAQGGLIAPGPTVMQAIGQFSHASKYSVQIGNMLFAPVVFQKVEPTVSLDTDTLGYPIWIILKIDVKSIYTATTNSLDNLDVNKLGSF
jgi:hypothetical protein